MSNVVYVVIVQRITTGEKPQKEWHRLHQREENAYGYVEECLAYTETIEMFRQVMDPDLFDGRALRALACFLNRKLVEA